MDMLEKSEDIIAYIKNSKKKTPVKAYIRGNLPNNIVTNTSVKILLHLVISTLWLENMKRYRIY